MNKEFSAKVAVYLVLTKNRNILLIKRFNTGWQDGKYTLISGHVEGNETLTQAMSREAFEEAGIKILPKNLQVIHVMRRRSNTEYVDFYLTPSYWSGTPKLKELNKADDIRWFSLIKLPRNLLGNVKKALSEIKSHNVFSDYI
jgi:8-oxo-dGTP diphosphatase